MGNIADFTSAGFIVRQTHNVGIYTKDRLWEIMLLHASCIRIKCFEEVANFLYFLFINRYLVNTWSEVPLVLIVWHSIQVWCWETVLTWDHYCDNCTSTVYNRAGSNTGLMLPHRVCSYSPSSSVSSLWSSSSLSFSSKVDTFGTGYLLIPCFLGYFATFWHTTEDIYS